jgi:hypothetical protein
VPPIRPWPCSIRATHFGLDTPTGREHRITALACDYGVNSITGADAATASTVVYADVDALAALGTQDVEGLGTATRSPTRSPPGASTAPMAGCC